jgi:hypothetical protein
MKCLSHFIEILLLALYIGYERNQVYQEPTRNQEFFIFFQAGTATCPGSPFFIKPRTET